MKRVTISPGRRHDGRIGRPPKPPQRLPRVRRKDLPVVKLPGQSRRGGGKTRLTNHRAAVVLHALGCGCYRETAAQLAGATPETLTRWMKWDGEPYATFQRLVRKAEADLEARMVTALTSQVHVRPELALAILERKFPQRWAKVTVVAMPPSANKIDLGQMLHQIDVQRQAEQAARGQLPPASTIINTTAVPAGRLQDPRGPRPVRPPDDAAPQPAGSPEPTARPAEPVTPVDGRSVVPATVTRLGRARPPT
jgi:hypothetical protein